MKIRSLTARYGLLFTLSALSLNAGAATINPGDLVVSELLANPAAVTDTNGEWLELFNRSHAAIDLNGLIVRDEGSNTHTVSSMQALVMLPGEYLVLGRNGDKASNGGYQADYVYSNFSLANSSDNVTLEWKGMTIFSLSYTATDKFGQAGTSMALHTLSENITPQDYEAATKPFGIGDLGTPGNGSLGEISEVPLPAAAWLFASSIGLLAGIKRRSARA